MAQAMMDNTTKMGDDPSMIALADGLLRAVLAGTIVLLCQPLLAFNMPPANPFLADSNYAMAYGDADPGDPTSAITKLREFQLPPEATGPIMGLSMTYDG